MPNDYRHAGLFFCLFPRSLAISFVMIILHVTPPKRLES